MRNHFFPHSRKTALTIITMATENRKNVQDFPKYVMGHYNTAVTHNIQLFRERLSHKSVKVNETMSKVIVGNGDFIVP